MGDIRREMERLRPIYETGVLRLLLRNNSMIYVALLKSCFDPLTGELPREILEDRLVRGLTHLVDVGEYTLKDGQDVAQAAHRILIDLSREGDGDYAWLANYLDAASHRYLYRLTARAHRAIEALGKLEDSTQVLSGAQANSIIMEIEHARMQLTDDPKERIALLRREIEAREREIDELEHSDTIERLTAKQVEDIINVVHNTLRGVPIDLRELVLSERDSGDALRRRMQSGMMSVDEILTAYHDEFRKSFRESDSGRRFEDAFQVIVTEEGRRQIDDAVRDIARNPYLDGEPGIVLGQVRAELERIYEGIEDVRRQMRASDEAISRLVRQQTDTRYRTMLTKLNRLFAETSALAKSNPNDQSKLYETGTGVASIAALPSRPARPMSQAKAPGLPNVQDSTQLDASRWTSMLEVGGPRLRRMLALIDKLPSHDDDNRINLAEAFNQLDERERRESELIGFLGSLPAAEDGEYVLWRCISLDGTERTWRTRPVIVERATLERIVKEG
ncbi:DUF3375 family protein [Bifidobacterium oedipodis]|uniref:Methyl-accepting chemotaxis protein n=1 Tax=Bifidobacterium oedipodis TaxID=2675322 RepID=A0A7Y0HT71_9BIFI|nr:DUF3375 family protein [Bifidobacterium sp. DSM 109957]NMM94323.1 methyl-accepting chemotaxis protein [Bifidobacterium sp. DSM 109957]